MDEFNDTHEQILQSDAPDADKVARLFELRANVLLERKWQREVELAAAMHDEDSVLKGRIKLGVLTSILSMYRASYERVTGRRDWDEYAKS